MQSLKTLLLLVRNGSDKIKAKETECVTIIRCRKAEK
jgi:hypothetical protein